MEAEGRESNLCSSCKEVEATWRCLHCLGRRLLCTGCCRTTHFCLPFHRVEQWAGTHWAPSWLINVGCEIHLGHNGDRCPTTGEWQLAEPVVPAEDDWVDEEDIVPAEALDPANTTHALHREAGSPVVPPGDISQVVTIVDSSGVHQLVVRPCRCVSNQDPDDIQLLKMGLFPASFR